jgi:hypothetical protein
MMVERPSNNIHITRSESQIIILLGKNIVKAKFLQKGLKLAKIFRFAITLPALYTKMYLLDTTLYGKVNFYIFNETVNYFIIRKLRRHFCIGR